jgi:hypothetical protein
VTVLKRELLKGGEPAICISINRSRLSVSALSVVQTDTRLNFVLTKNGWINVN